MTLQDLCILLFFWHTGHHHHFPHERNVWPISRLCAQSSPALCQENADISRFAGRPVIQSSSKLNGCTSQPIENQTGQAPFWKNWCAKSVSGVGLCEASALRPEQIGKLWFLGNSLSLLDSCNWNTSYSEDFKLRTHQLSKDIQRYPEMFRCLLASQDMWM